MRQWRKARKEGKFFSKAKQQYVKLSARKSGQSAPWVGVGQENEGDNGSQSDESDYLHLIADVPAF